MRPVGPRSARPLRWRAASVALLAAGTLCTAAPAASAATLTLAQPPNFVPGAGATLTFGVSGTADAAKSDVSVAVHPIGMPCGTTIKEEQGRPGFQFVNTRSFSPGPFSGSLQMTVGNLLEGRYQVCGYLYPWSEYPLPGVSGPYDQGAAPAASASTTLTVERLGGSACPTDPGAAYDRGCGPFASRNYPMKTRLLRWKDYRRLVEGPRKRRLDAIATCSRPCKLHAAIAFSPASARKLGLSKRGIDKKVSTRTTVPAGNFIEVVRFDFGFSKALTRKIKKLKTLEFVVTSYATEDGGDGRVNRRPVKLVFTGPK